MCQLQCHHIRKTTVGLYTILTILIIELRTVFALMEEGKEKGVYKTRERLEATVSPSQCYMGTYLYDPRVIAPTISKTVATAIASVIVRVLELTAVAILRGRDERRGKSGICG